MNKKIAVTSALLSTLVGLSHVAYAADAGHTFTPLENLPPEQRQEISAQVADLTHGLQIDWDSIAIGLDENGNISLRSKNEFKAQAVGGFSCYSAKAVENDGE